MPYQIDETLKEFGNCSSCGAFFSFLDHSSGFKSENNSFKVDIPLDLILD
jgi:hypothetical protein